MSDRLEECRQQWEIADLTTEQGDWLIAEVDALRAENAEQCADKEHWYKEAERLRAVVVAAVALADEWRSYGLPGPTRRDALFAAVVSYREAS